MAITVAPLLTSQQVTVRIGVTSLFEALDLTLHPGDRLGIVGPNGAGKSTLLRILAGLGKADSGHVAWRTQLRKAYVSQSIPFSIDDTVEKVLVDQLHSVFGNNELVSLQQRYDKHLHLLETDPNLGSDDQWLSTLAQLQHLLDEQQSSGVDIPNALAGTLRVSGLATLANRKVAELSGGQQKRLQLTHALISQPQLLLLDEPTNHLDVETVEWLEDVLLDLSETGFQMLGVPPLSQSPEPIAMAIVSHDRALLDTLANRIVEIAGGEAQFYTGSYETYAVEKVRRMEETRSRNQRMANLMRRELAWLQRGAAARTTKQTARINRAKNLESHLHVAEKKAAVKPKASLEFNASLDSRERNADDLWISVKDNLGTQKLLELSSITLKHPRGEREPMLAKDLSLVVKPSMRLALVGPNGCGKTHLLKLLAGDTQPHDGLCQRHELIKVSYFDQHRHALEAKTTVRQTLCPEGDFVHTNEGYLHIMSYLEKFLFSRYDAERLIENLSGGEQARVLLAKLMLEQANTLILDEPTNDLDIPTLQALEETLVQFSGCVVFTSHDRYFIQRVATQILVFSGLEKTKEGREFYRWTLVPNLEQALQILPRADANTNPENKEKDTKKSTENLSKDNSYIEKSNQKQKLSHQEKKELEKLEALLIKKEQEIEMLNEKIHLAYAENKPFQEIQALQNKLLQMQNDLSDCQKKWESLYERS